MTLEASSYCSEISVGQSKDGTPVPPHPIVEVRMFSNLCAVQEEGNRKSGTVGNAWLLRTFLYSCARNALLFVLPREMKVPPCNSLRTGVAIVAIGGLF